MGKGKNKNKEKDSYSGSSNRRNRDDDSDSDDSVSTHLTLDDDLQSVQGDVDDIETVLDALAEHIDNATHKNISIRMAAMRNLQLALTSQYLPDFVLKWKATLLDIITKNLKKTDEECMVSAVLLALVAIQVGEEIDDLIEECVSYMRTVVMNPAKGEGLRGTCALSLALTCHLACDDDESITESLKALRHAWGSIKCNSPNTRLFTTTLPAWALLLQSADHKCLTAALADYAKLSGYLEATQLDNRIAAGEVIAFVYELARNTSGNYRFPNHAQIVEILDALSNDCSKIKAKRDRRVQRFSFRQIQACIVDRDAPSVTVKFSRQSLILESCSDKLFYDLCCEVLHGGMMRQLENNEMLREIFDLGPIPEVTGKVDKLTRMAYFEDASKYRNQKRGKQRDKRAVVL